MSKVIKITVHADGTSLIDGEGFKGNECLSRLKPFEDILGSAHDLTMKDEIYMDAETVSEGQETVLESM